MVKSCVSGFTYFGDDRQAVLRGCQVNQQGTERGVACARRAHWPSKLAQAFRIRPLERVAAPLQGRLDSLAAV